MLNIKEEVYSSIRDFLSNKSEEITDKEIKEMLLIAIGKQGILQLILDTLQCMGHQLNLRPIVEKPEQNLYWIQKAQNDRMKKAFDGWVEMLEPIEDKEKINEEETVQESK